MKNNILRPTPGFESRAYCISSLANGALILRVNAGVTLISMTVQVTAACTIQIFETGKPITAAYSLPAGAIWSLPSRYLANNTSLFLALSAGTANFDICFSSGHNPHNLINDENRFYFSSSSSSSSAVVFKNVNTSAIGTNPVLTVPAGKRWLVKLIRLQLTTSATVATRTVQIAANNGANNVMFAQAGASQAASLSQGYTFAPSLPNGAAFIGGNITTGFPELALDDGYVITTTVVNLQVGDTIAINTDVEEFTN